MYKFKLSLLIICTILLILIPGCKKAENPLITESIRPTPVITDSSAVDILIGTNKGVMELDYGDYRNSFSELILEKFNINLVPNLTFSDDGSRYLKEFFVSQNDLFIANFVFPHKVLRDVRNSNQILPINDYANTSNIWQNLPDSFKNDYMDSNGDIWGLPISDTPVVFARMVNNEWLKQMNLHPPQTIDELYSVFKNFTFEDPDQNGNNDTFGTGLSDRYLSFLLFKDVFETNGCHLSYSYATNTNGLKLYNVALAGYNPNTGIIEDSLAQDSFINSLLFIETLFKEGLILGEHDFIEDGLYLNPKVGTHFGLIETNNTYSDKYSYVYSLNSETDSHKTSILQNGYEVLYISHNINNPDIAVPTFIDTFYGNSEAYKIARYGLDDNEASLYKTRIEFLGDISWLNAELLSYNTLDGKIPLEFLYDSNNFSLLSHRHMGILENTCDTHEDEAFSTYEKEISDAFYNFCKGDYSATDLNEILTKIHKVFNMEQWIIDTNQKWLGK